MTTGNDKLVQYLNEARATEEALVRTLQAHIAITPKGDYRKVLERHLKETERHRDRVDTRLEELGEGRGAIESGVGVLQSLAGNVLSMSKAPLDVVRGETGEEKLLKNAKDECATEALEIATYEALEALANHLGDTKTADLARRIRAEEERMLADLQKLIPSLTQAAADAEITQSTYDVTTTGAADAAREAAARGRSAMEQTRERVSEAARDAVERVTAAAREAVRRIAEAADRGEDVLEATTKAAVSGVRQTADEAEKAVRRTAEAARENAADTVDEAEREAKKTQRTAKRQTKSTARTAKSSSSSSGGNAGQPWPGYDDQSVGEINKRLSDANEDLAKKVRDYERRHKNRSTVMQRARAKV